MKQPPENGFPSTVWDATRPTDRVARIRQRLLTAERRVDLERARITTDSYRRTEGLPMPVRRATMLRDLARRTSIAIYDGERIVGNRSLLPRMGVIAPEGAVDWIDRELEILPTRPQDRFDIAPDEIAVLREQVFPYWRGKTLEDVVAERVPEHVRRAVKARAFSLNQTDHAQGHILPDVATWLDLGIGGLRARARTAARRTAGDPAKAVFYEASAIALDAAALLMRRYARLAAHRARKEADPGRARELREVAARCRWLAEGPARNFPDALQAVWFLFVILQMESNASSFSPGRLDQYLLPYLEADLTSGALTLEAAQEWLELLWLKFNEIVLLRSSSSARYFAGFPIGFNVILGGQTADGGDATNLLSYMCLRAQADVGLTQPNLSIRIHRDSPQPFLRAAAAVIGRGGGMPQVFNDEVIIPGQIRRGVDPADARDYAVVGCVELSVPGKALGWSDAAMFNMTRVLELTLYGGRDPQTGEQIGLPTPPLDRMPDFAALEAAYDAQLGHFVGLMAEGCAVVDRIHAELLPSPFLSLVVRDCLSRGVDVTAGGARYNFSGVQGVQVANVADSLAAVKQAVFDERWVGGGELLAALRGNYEGAKQLRHKLINRAPKFGNDDDRADLYAARWADRYSELVAGYSTVRGGVYQPGFYTVSAHVPMGAHVGATPDGRKAGEPLADGGLSPAAGRDRRGPTAVLRSVGKIDLELASNGALLNMKFLPSFFQGVEALDSFVRLLRGFSALKIPHVQFNVVLAETLRKAQARPEEFRGLVVRVAGYSAYFTELDRVLQDEIIARTEFEETR
jgi:formate C-acetyltransferase